jgi:hypothetical protein
MCQQHTPGLSRSELVHPYQCTDGIPLGRTHRRRLLGGNATVLDMHSFAMLVGCVVSLFDSAGSRPEASVSPPLSLKDSNWQDLGSASDASTHGPNGQTKVGPAQPPQWQALWPSGP